MGFEPTTCGLRNRCSTAELLQHLEFSLLSPSSRSELIQNLFSGQPLEQPLATNKKRTSERLPTFEHLCVSSLRVKNILISAEAVSLCSSQIYNVMFRFATKLSWFQHSFDSCEWKPDFSSYVGKQRIAYMTFI